MQSQISALSSSVQDISNKVGNEQSGLVHDLSAHVANSDVHITTDERAAWNAKQEQVVAGEFIKLAEDKKTISVDFTGLVLDGGTAND